MAALNDKVKAFIVYGFANFMTPQEIIGAVKKEFDIDVTSPQVSFYNPNTINANKELGQRWRDLFEEYRQIAIGETQELWIAHKPQRLKKLQSDFEKSKNPKLRLEILEQAAKEVGEVFTNKQTVNSKVEQTTETTHNFASADEFREIAAEVLAKV